MFMAGSLTCGHLSAAGLDEATAAAFAALDGNIAEGALGHVFPDLSMLIEHPTARLKESVERFLS